MDSPQLRGLHGRTAIKAKKYTTTFLKEQDTVVLTITNAKELLVAIPMAAQESFTLELVLTKGIKFVLCLLQRTKVPTVQSITRKATLERDLANTMENATVNLSVLQEKQSKV